MVRRKPPWMPVQTWIETQIARNPLTAVLIALGFGFAVGILSRSK